MIIKQKCFVRIEDREVRSEFCEWLKTKNIFVCICSLFDGWNTLNCSNIDRNDKLQVEVHGVPDYDPETGYNVGQFKLENKNAIDFGSDIIRFKQYIETNLINN